MRSMVCYQYFCPVDQAVSYIGRTKRHLLTRIEEHVSPKENSPVLNHVLNCTCTFDRDQFSITGIHSANNELDLAIAEAILISQKKPVLNTALANKGASVFLKL